MAPAAFLFFWFLPIPSLKAEAHRLLAIEVAVVTLWITEAIPAPVTAMLGPALCVICGVETARNALKNFADPIVFLILGSFLIAEGMVRHGLNHRIAFRILAPRSVS